MQGVEIHLQSLALTMVFVSTASFLCMAPAIFRFPEEYRGGLRTWIIGTALVATTDIVFFTGIDIPFLDIILIAFAGLGIAEWLHALRLFDRKVRRTTWPYFIVLAATVLSGFFPGYPATGIVTSIAFGTLYLGVAVVGVRICLPGPSIGRAVLVAVFATIGCVLLSRVVMFMASSGSGASPGFTSVPRAIMFIVASAGPFAGSLGFVLMCGEKLGNQLLHLSLTDPLTGIPNRRAFLESLERALSSGRRHSESVTVLVVDIDHFKRINDEAGHLAGDQALVEVARRLARAIRAEDMFGRLGGDEFGVVQSGTDLDTATAAADRVRKSIASQPFVVKDRGFDLTASIGVAVSSTVDREASDLLSRADRLLYVAKSRGRDQVTTETDA